MLINCLCFRLADAVSLVHLYQIIHPESNSSKDTSDMSEIGVLKAYITHDSVKKNVLELALQSCLQLQKQKKDVNDGIQRAHGH